MGVRILTGLNITTRIIRICKSSYLAKSCDFSCDVEVASIVPPHGMSMETVLDVWDDTGMEFHILFGTSSAHLVLALLLPIRSHSMLVILAHTEITSESVANGFA